MILPLPRSIRSDSELVQSIARGELDALGELFDRHEAALCRFFHRLGMSSADTDDLVQATFLEVMRAAPRFDPLLPLSSWLYGLASIMARRHRRSLARTAKRILAWASLGFAATPQNPATELDQQQDYRRFQVALSRLSEKKREVFVLVVLEGLSGEEAARALHIPVNTVWTRLHHARHELRAALEQSA